MKKQQPQFKEDKMTSPITGGQNCFRVYTEPKSIEYYLCMGSGFMSHSDFSEESETLKTLLSKSPSSYPNITSFALTSEPIPIGSTILVHPKN